MSELANQRLFPVRQVAALLAALVLVVGVSVPALAEDGDGAPPMPSSFSFAVDPDGCFVHGINSGRTLTAEAVFDEPLAADEPYVPYVVFYIHGFLTEAVDGLLSLDPDTVELHEVRDYVTDGEGSYTFQLSNPYISENIQDRDDPLSLADLEVGAILLIAEAGEPFSGDLSDYQVASFGVASSTYTLCADDGPGDTPTDPTADTDFSFGMFGGLWFGSTVWVHDGPEDNPTDWAYIMAPYWEDQDVAGVFDRFQEQSQSQEVWWGPNFSAGFTFCEKIEPDPDSPGYYHCASDTPDLNIEVPSEGNAYVTVSIDFGPTQAGGAVLCLPPGAADPIIPACAEVTTFEELSYWCWPGGQGWAEANTGSDICQMAAPRAPSAIYVPPAPDWEGRDYVTGTIEFIHHVFTAEGHTFRRQETRPVTWEVCVGWNFCNPADTPDTPDTPDEPDPTTTTTEPCSAEHNCESPHTGPEGMDGGLIVVSGVALLLAGLLVRPRRDEDGLRR